MYVYSVLQMEWFERCNPPEMQQEQAWKEDGNGNVGVCQSITKKPVIRVMLFDQHVWYKNSMNLYKYFSKQFTHYIIKTKLKRKKENEKQEAYNF